jgi:hypothetical protein
MTILTLASSLCAQDAQRPVSWIKFRVTVSDGTRDIGGLKPGDFRVFEDGIPQRISTFAEGTQPTLLVNDDGTTSSMAAPSGEAGEPGLDLTPSIREDPDHSYTITYSRNPSNQGQGFRKIRVEMVPGAKWWTLRHPPGYRIAER